MTTEKQRLVELAGQIVAEHDPAKFLKLLQQLNELLDEKEKEDRPSPPAGPSGDTTQHRKEPPGSGNEHNPAA